MLSFFFSSCTIYIRPYYYRKNLYCMRDSWINKKTKQLSYLSNDIFHIRICGVASRKFRKGIFHYYCLNKDISIEKDKLSFDVLLSLKEHISKVI